MYYYFLKEPQVRIKPPFKSSLFGVVEKENLNDYFLQPVTLSYNKLDGIPVDLKYRPFLAWFGGMDLFSHAGNFRFRWL